MSDHAKQIDQHTCKSCGNVFTGIYCNECGEKIIQPAERSFKTFINGVLIAVTFADSKLIKTLWLIIKKPGFVSREFASGRTVKYLKPSSVFFVLNLFYFFFPVIQLFNASLNTQLRSPHGEFIKGLLALKIVKMNMNLDSFTLIYNNKTVSLAKLMVMVFVVLASLPLNFLYAKRNRFFSDHVGYAIELACFNLFINAIVLTFIVRLLGLGRYLDENVLTGIFIATNLYFLIRSGINFYNEKGWRLILKSAFMIVVLVAALEIYRIILFFVTIWTM
jgi:Protein of unknown function (DUF3667)